MAEVKVLDDLDAVRTIVETLKPFKQGEQVRILRWVSEKTGLPALAGASQIPTILGAEQKLPEILSPPRQKAAPPDGGKQDIKSFVDEKNPRSDVQFAATVAYYLRFEAPPAEMKEYVTKEDLQEACRKAKRDRLVNPYQTLKNAHTLGLLDNGPEKATFVINTVGENLVAMSLPKGTNDILKPRKAKKAIKPGKKQMKTTKKVVTKKAGKP
jgi:hypothetical protein